MTANQELTQALALRDDANRQVNRTANTLRRALLLSPESKAEIATLEQAFNDAVNTYKEYESLVLFWRAVKQGKVDLG